MNVTGLTTAASIWVTAALGMAIGSHNYSLAGIGAALTIIVLFLFGYFQNLIDRLHHTRSYKVILHKNQEGLNELKSYMRSINLTCRAQSQTKNDDEIYFSFGVAGKKEKIEDFNSYLLTAEYVKSFEC
jgi:putative Mg2+ transporter-C (MgtC) family protein